MMMQISFSLVRVPSYNPANKFQEMAKAYYLLPVEAGNHMSATLVPVWGSAADYYQVAYSVGEQAPSGWISLTVLLRINALEYGTKPGFLYIGEPTDSPTEILRFEETEGRHLPPSRNNPYGYEDAGCWLLMMRRSS